MFIEKLSPTSLSCIQLNNKKLVEVKNSIVESQEHESCPSIGSVKSDCPKR